MDNEVRRKMASSPEELMRDFLDEDIGDERHDIYTGIVVNNNDPDKEGKCKIRVYGVFEDDVPDSDLPWALPDFSFVGSLVGNFTVPPVGTKVNVYFDKGDIYFPHYFSKSVQKSKQPKQKNVNYPDNVVMWETDDGDYLTLNRKTKETTFNHNSGTKVIIKKDGSVEITGEANINIQASNTVDIKGTNTLLIHGTPVPNGTTGSLCLLPNCLFTGAVHQTNKSIGGNP